MIVASIAITAITALEFYAIKKGINGKAMALSIACISGIGGFTIGHFW